MPGTPRVLRGDDVAVLTAEETTAVATIVGFVTAFNGGHVSQALGLVVDEIVISDCDYSSGDSIFRSGRSEVETWLIARARDHDQIELGDVTLGDHSAGPFALAVSIANRTSDSIRAGGHSTGIVPGLAVKAIVLSDGTRLMGWNGGPCPR
jgi:hypothetical protein